jgi:hypothetical protein
MKVTLSPTGRFETVNQGDGRVLCRIWEGTTDSGAKIIAHIPMIGLHNSAPPEDHQVFENALREIKVERDLVSIDMRMVM